MKFPPADFEASLQRKRELSSLFFAAVNQTEVVIISSRQHPLVQLARSLQRAKGRRESGLFLIEGKNAVEAALRTDFPIREVLAAENERELSEMALDKGLEVRRATAEILTYASEAQSAPSIVALAEIPAPLEADFPDFTLVLDEISDPGNVGTLWRAGDAAGIGAIFPVGGADPWSPKVVRSAAGSLFHLPPRCATNLALGALIERFESQNVPLIAAQAHGAQNCFEFEWPARAALILGHETRGISQEFERAADFAVTIPTFGRAESLNVAMAGTVLLFAWAQHQARH